MTIQISSERLPVLRPAAALLPITPEEKQPERCRLPVGGRGMGTLVLGTKGSGKSRLLGRKLAWEDFLRLIPLIILDPVGGTIDNFLDKIARQPRDVRRKLWKRVVYINVYGQDGRVFPWPIYYEAKRGEPYSDQSQRYVDVVDRADPRLRSAAMQGYNAFAPLASAGGIILAALGLGITELWSLVSEPAKWQQQLERLEQTHPDTAGAIDEIRALWESRDQTTQRLSLRGKLSPFRFKNNFRAIFGATTPRLNLADVIKKKQAVLIDFRDVRDLEMRKFCLLWIYHSFLTYIMHRGNNQMKTPVSFLVDELSYMVGSAKDTDNPLIADIEELISRIARSHGVWVTLSTQELYQLPPQMQKAVLSMGNIFVGRLSEPEGAESLARRFFLYDPDKIKHVQVRFEKLRKGAGRFYHDTLVPAEEKKDYYTKGEQQYFNGRRFLRLKRYHFYAGVSREEGELATELRPVSIEDCDPGEFAEPHIINPLRSELMRRDGIKQSVLLAEINRRLTHVGRPTAGPARSGATPGTDTALPQTDTTQSQLPPPPETDTVVAEPVVSPRTRTRRPKPPKSPQPVAVP